MGPLYDRVQCGMKHLFFHADTDSVILSTLLDFIYSGNIMISSSSVWHLLTAATHLQLTDALQLCHTFIDKNMQINTGPSTGEVRCLTQIKNKTGKKRKIKNNCSSLILLCGNCLILQLVESLLVPEILTYFFEP